MENLIMEKILTIIMEMEYGTLPMRVGLLQISVKEMENGILKWKSIPCGG